MKEGFSMDVEQEIKKKINKVLEERQLCSVMNNTKWGTTESSRYNHFAIRSPSTN
jgi:hypothetical protein